MVTSLMLEPLHFPRTAEEQDFITPQKRVIRRCPSKRSPDEAVVPYTGDKGKGKGGGKATAKSSGKGKKGKAVEAGHKGKGRAAEVEQKGKGKSKEARPGLTRATHLEDSAKTEKYAEPVGELPATKQRAAAGAHAESAAEDSNKPAKKKQKEEGAEPANQPEPPAERRKRRLKRADESTWTLSCDDAAPGSCRSR